jgi:hypothetical protein
MYHSLYHVHHQAKQHSVFPKILNSRSITLLFTNELLILSFADADAIYPKRKYYFR